MGYQGDDPLEISEWHRVRYGHEDAVRAYERAQRAVDRARERYPDPVKRVLQADEYGPPPVTWEEVRPYVWSAVDAASAYGDAYSHDADEFVLRVRRWFQRTWEEEVEVWER